MTEIDSTWSVAWDSQANGIVRAKIEAPTDKRISAHYFWNDIEKFWEYKVKYQGKTLHITEGDLTFRFDLDGEFEVRRCVIVAIEYFIGLHERTEQC